LRRYQAMTEVIIGIGAGLQKIGITKQKFTE
jgi:hypothetical protein